MLIAKVFKEEGQWWARYYEEHRCVWMGGPFTSARKAQRAVEKIEHAEEKKR